MTQLGRRFSLSPATGAGVCCGETGLFVDDVHLLEVNQDQPGRWQPRPVSNLNRDLSERYGLPIDCNAKTGGLAAIARALNRGDILHAQIVALHLQFPDPPALTKAALNAGEIVDLARQLRASGLLKADWDPLKHPRWPAGAPGSIGGEFAPRGGVADDSVIEDQNAPVIPAQLTLPVPWVVPRGAPVPWPSEITPTPFAPPNTNPITIPRNPYPGRPKCVAEWAEATEYCNRPMDKRPDGKGLQSGTGPNSQRMHYGPRVAGLWWEQGRRLIIDRMGTRHDEGRTLTRGNIGASRAPPCRSAALPRGYR